MENFPEASYGCSLKCTSWNYKTGYFVFYDLETDKPYSIDKTNLLKAFTLLFTDKWPKGCTPPPVSADPKTWNDWLCTCDAQDFDAFAQLACLGEVIYG
jgi:hypothetical protein